MNEPNERKELNNEVQEIDGSAPFRLRQSACWPGCGGTPSNTETGTPSTGDPGTEATGSAASGESSLKGKRVRVVIGSTSTGGDSYMIADMVTRYLGEEMGFNGKVDAIGQRPGAGHHLQGQGRRHHHHDVPRHGVPERTLRRGQ